MHMTLLETGFAKNKIPETVEAVILTSLSALRYVAKLPPTDLEVSLSGARKKGLTMDTHNSNPTQKSLLRFVVAILSLQCCSCPVVFNVFYVVIFMHL